MFSNTCLKNGSQPAQPIKLLSISDPELFKQRAQDLLAIADSHTVISRLPRPEALGYLRSVERVFTDFDGTIVAPGETRLDKRTKAAIAAADRAGVEVIGVTGKPYAEITGMVNDLGSDTPLRFLFEKGAFILGIDQFGRPEKRFLLATPAAIAATAAVKAAYQQQWKAEIEQQLRRSGTPVRLELAGTGTHECVFSLDILDPRLAGDNFREIGGGRRAIKVQDRQVIKRVTDLMHARVTTMAGFDHSQAVNLGNSNIEWAPANTVCRVEKDLGIAKYAGFKVSEDPISHEIKISANGQNRTSAVLGDSGNDRPMFALAKSLPRIRSHLVYHLETPSGLVDQVDFLSPGLSNGVAHLELIIAAKNGAFGN